MQNTSRIIQENDLVQLVGASHKYFLLRLKKGETFQTHRGFIHHDDLIGKEWGSKIESHLGRPFYLLQPSIDDLLRNLPRSTQIIYPKDMGFILLKLNIQEGTKIIEAGTGSGALTIALTTFCGDSGHVYSYERREQSLTKANQNIGKYGRIDRVTFIKKDIIDGFEQNDVDCIFLDLPNPYDFMKQVKDAVKPGGIFGALLPTSNQVSKLIDALENNGFGFINICEILLRYYKADSERFRPVDRMIAHTGFLIFARSIEPDDKIETNFEEEI